MDILKSIVKALIFVCIVYVIALLAVNFFWIFIPIALAISIYLADYSKI